MYGFVLVAVYKCLNIERAKRARKNVASYELPDIFALRFLLLPCF